MSDWSKSCKSCSWEWMRWQTRILALLQIASALRCLIPMWCLRRKCWRRRGVRSVLSWAAENVTVETSRPCFSDKQRRHGSAMSPDVQRGSQPMRGIRNKGYYGGSILHRAVLEWQAYLLRILTNWSLHLNTVLLWALWIHPLSRWKGPCASRTGEQCWGKITGDWNYSFHSFLLISPPAWA